MPPDRRLSGALCKDSAVRNRYGEFPMSFTLENFTVWAEIPATDMDRAIAFYNKVFDTKLKKCEEGRTP